MRIIKTLTKVAFPPQEVSPGTWDFFEALQKSKLSSPSGSPYSGGRTFFKVQDLSGWDLCAEYADWLSASSIFFGLLRCVQ